jgi:hypothetical protein
LDEPGVTTHDLWAADPAFVDLSTRLRRNCPALTHTGDEGLTALLRGRRGAGRAMYLVVETGMGPRNAEKVPFR